MSYFNDTNRGRVKKIVELLDLISKSGNANKVDREHVWDMLELVINRIDDMLGNENMRAAQEAEREATQESQEAPQKPRSTTSAPSYIQIREAAETASLKDLTYAMAVFMNRVDEELCK